MKPSSALFSPCRALAACSLLLAASLSGPAQAFVGPPVVRSNLGEPLVVELPLLSVRPGDRIRVVEPHWSASSREMHPALRNARVSSVEVDGARFVRISTTTAIEWPWLPLTLELETETGTMVRSVDLLLDPPSRAAREAPVASAPALVISPALAIASLPPGSSAARADAPVPAAAASGRRSWASHERVAQAKRAREADMPALALRPEMALASRVAYGAPEPAAARPMALMRARQEFESLKLAVDDAEKYVRFLRGRLTSLEKDLAAAGEAGPVAPAGVAPSRPAPARTSEGPIRFLPEAHAAESRPVEVSHSESLMTVIVTLACLIVAAGLAIYFTVSRRRTLRERAEAAARDKPLPRAVRPAAAAIDLDMTKIGERGRR